ncbi:MAG: TonB-dependent receptor [Bacteroidota bacterium]
MKLMTVLFFLAITNLMASEVYSQTTRMTLQLKDATVKEVLSKIEENSEFFFLYNSKLVDINRKVSVDVNNQKISEILSNMFLGTDVVYAVVDRQVVLTNTANQRGFAQLGSLQPQKVTGIVTDKNGNPVIGANVVVTGTTIGALTDISGKYSIEIPQGSKTLTFSFIGMESQEVSIGALTLINVTMTESAIGLDEVVVVGYSTQTKKSLTSSISTVKTTELTDGTAASPISRLQGRASGVTIVDSHTPGSDPQITIRGLSTINNSSPLIIIDGVPAGGLSMVNTDEIESITVLKDATSAAIYGARGANGVVIITTKRGSAGKLKVSFSTRYSVSSFHNPFTMLNPKQMGEMLWLQAKNQGINAISPLYGSGATPVVPDYIVPAGAMEGDPRTDPSLYNYNQAGFNNITKANKTGTDWYGSILNNGAPLSESNLSISGGGEKGVYAVNFGYLTQEGICKYTSYNRYTIRANSDMRINNWLKIGESLGVAFSNGKGDLSEGHEWTAVGYANTMWAIIPLKDINGNWAGTAGTGNNGTNPLAYLSRSQDNASKNLSVVGNLYGEFQILKGLKFKSLFGFNLGPSSYRGLTRQSPESQEPVYTDQLNQANSESYQWNLANTLNYTKAFGPHTVDVLLGTEAISNIYSGIGASRSTFYTNSNTYMELSSGEADIMNSGYSGATSTVSYFGRINYDYSGRYLLEFTVRRDGSSRFGKNNRWGNFPAASAGWVLSEEGFLSGMKDKGNSLKLRGGYGLSGNDQIGDYNGFSLYGLSMDRTYYAIDGSHNTATPGFAAATFGNPDAKWESTSTLDLGIDIGLFKNKLTATFDIWNRKTKGMLFQMAVPYVSGNAVPPAVNIGKMDNNGFDLSINYANKAMNGDFTYNLGLIVSHYKNKVVSISDSPKEFISGTAYRYQTYTRAQAGTAYPEFYGLIVDGIFQTQAEADAAPAIPGTGYNIPGHFKYRDVSGPDGVPDGILDENDFTYIGSPHPKFTTGLNFDIGYKAFNLSVFLYSSYGNKIADYTKRWYDYGIFSSNLSTDALYKSWGSPYLSNNANATLPLADNNDLSVIPSTAFLQDGSYLRLKTLQLSYTLPKKICDKLTVSKLQVYLQGTNLVTLTKFKGWDPEIVTRGMDKGVQAAQWPTAKMVMFGIKLDL